MHPSAARCRRILFSLCIVLTAAASQAQRPVTNAFVSLTTKIDSQNVQKGDTVDLKVLREIDVNGRTVIPRDAQIVGHIAEVLEGKRPQLSLVVDKAVLKNKREIPLQGIIVAIAPPAERADAAANPEMSMMRSQEPTRNDPATSSATANSSVAAATELHLEGRGPALSLSADSQGAIGFDNAMTLTWQLQQPPPVTVITAKKRFVLERGTQMLIRMAPPNAQ